MLWFLVKVQLQKTEQQINKTPSVSPEKCINFTQLWGHQHQENIGGIVVLQVKCKAVSQVLMMMMT